MKKRDIEKRCCAGRSKEWQGVRTINPPVYNGSTVLFDSFEDLVEIASGQYEGIAYGTDRLPTQRAFEEHLSQLEGGAVTRAFQSGISAITSVLQAFTRSGDHILLCENVYGPTATFCKKILSKYAIEVDFLPASIGADIVHWIKPNTRLVFMESPGSNTFEIQDIPAITAITAPKGIITVLDNTWATPLFLNPFNLGVDVIIHSVTKYISGHSDVLLGSATINEKWSEEFLDYYTTMELFAPSQECYLALRGLKTLAVRLRQHEKSALTVARWLEEQPLVGSVIHPALTSHPQHKIWKRDFSGSSGLFAFNFAVDYPQEVIADFVNSLEMFGIGFSWGGFMSLVTAGKYSRMGIPTESEKYTIRLNVGLEEPDDLIEDIKSSFERMV